MDRSSDTTEPAEWQPATSRPGELYTVEGRIRASGAFVRGLANNDPRLTPYRRSMQRTAAMFVGRAIVAAICLAAVTALV